MNVYIYLEGCLYNCLDTSGKKLPKFFDIIVQNSRNSRFKQAKIEKRPLYSANFVRYKI